ncbi:glyoxylate reductase [Saccharomycopsis crataegensis]|uniref:Glyoxylate reductase n=1 Tax=Saccharomycopsis crataegensis TaxID=43959 RepID=A0AAV5QVQ3_9ASCO|nr:glyoxylate reductase [Saccharomycopsis crataegensis]
MTKKPLVLHTEPTTFGQQLWDDLEEIAEVVHMPETTDREQFIKDLKGKYSECVAIGRGYITNHRVGLFDEELISHLPPSVAYISHQGAGYDANDVAALSKRGIQLANCPGVVSAATADTNVFLMLGAMRNFDSSRRNLEAGMWPTTGSGAGSKIGISPQGKVLGILGMGAIGREVRDRVLPFGFGKIIYYNRSRLSPELEKGCEYIDNLDDFVAQADVISINCPLNKSTFHLVDDALFSKMKEGVVIVNTGRGAIIDESAMIKHLRSGKIRAAGLDVFENEPYVNTELLQFENVLATPHVGTSTEQTFYDMEKLVVDNIRAGLTTGKVLTLVPDQKFEDFGL